MSYQNSAIEQAQVKNILAVDDSPDNLLLIETLLEDIGDYRLHCTDNGPDALELITAEPPDLILLDVMMPEMDGYEVTQIVRSNSTLPFIPILLLTAHRQAEAVTGLDSGADDFIRKPFQVDELMARIRALLRLKESIDQQNKMMRQRDDFVARLTHDLRTPIIATNRVLEFCRRGTYGQELEAIQPYLSGVIENNEQLLHMVNSLLEVHRHEANRKKLTLVNIDLKRLVKTVVERLRPLAEDKGLELSLTYSDQFNAHQQTLMGDRTELSRVFTNLVGNAIKFTQQGQISLFLDYGTAESFAAQFSDCRLNSSERHYLVQVSDTGVGISPEDLPRIFDRFRPGTHVNSGSGLGLNLSKRIVELHQGWICITSDVGKQTTVFVFLPAKD